jgi:hypothetical protein
MAVFGIGTTWSLAKTDRRFRDTYYLHHQDTSEISVSFYQTTRRNIPEDSHLLIYQSQFALVWENFQILITILNEKEKKI